ncbi:MAG: MMPL family transporter, partial [Methylobacter sp.]|nr:MMPL family transporter [Methylobacter sp.]
SAPQAEASHGKNIELQSAAIEKIVTFGAKKPVITFLIAVFLTAVTGYGLLGLKVDTSADSMLSSNDPMLPAYQTVVKEFGSDNIVLVHYQGDELFTPQKLKVLDEVTYALQNLDIVEKVESLSTVLSIRDNGSGLEIAPLINTLPESKEEIAAIKSNAMYSPLIKANQLSEDGTKAAIIVTLRPSFRESEFNRDAHALIEKTIQPLQAEFSHVFQVGAPRVNVDFAVGLGDDLLFLTPLAVSVLIISIMLMLRTSVAVFIPLITAGLSIIWTLGILGYCGVPLNLLIAILPALVIVIGSTEDTHMLASYLQGLKENNSSERFPAIRFMAIHVGLPIFITSFTTMIGFLSNTISDITLIRDFGIASSIAMLANLVTTVLLLPLLLSLFGPKQAKMTTDIASSKAWEARFVRFIENAIEFHQVKILSVAAVSVLVFVGFATQITVSNDPMSFFKPDHKLVIDSQTLHEDLAGMQVFFITVEAAQHADFKDPAELKKIEFIEQAMAKQGVYDKVTSVNDFLKLVNQEMHQGDKAFYTVPQSRELVEQYLLLFQRNDLERVISADGRRVNLVVRHNLSKSDELNTDLAMLTNQINQALGDSNRFYLTGKNLMVNKAAESLFTSQQYSLVLLIVVIGILMSLLYSSVTAGLVTLIPNLIPVVIMFGTMGLLGIPLNPGTALVSVIAIGIAIDDTIHILSTYNKECRIDGDQNAATIRSVRIEAIPVISTSLALMAGFLMLQFSSFQIIAQFGLLSALTMLVAMLSDLLITPVLFKRIRLVSLWDVIALNLDKQALAKSAVFADMSPFQIKRVILLSKMREYKPGETVVQQGEMGSELFIILSGTVEVTYHDGDHEKLIAQLGWSDSFGEAGYAGNVARTASVIVSEGSEPLRVVMLNQDQVESAMRFYPRLHAKLNHNISKALARLLAGTTQMQHSS